MTTTRKLLGMGAASLLVMAAILTTVPAALADDKADHGDGNISRTFMYWGNVDWKFPEPSEKKGDPAEDGDPGRGLGWYDPSGPVCLFSLFGLRIGTGFYYDTLRVTTNAVQNTHVAHVGKTMVSVPCPFDIIDEVIFEEETDNNHKIGTSAFNVFVSPSISQSHLLCSNVGPGNLCTPDNSTAKWELYVCKDNPQEVQFDGGDLFGIRALVEALTGISPDPIGSSQLAGGKASDQCQFKDEQGNPTNDVNAYNATAYLDAPGNQSAFTPLHLDQLWSKSEKTKGPDTPSSYVVSCYRIEYDIFPQSQRREAKSHDWFLVLKTGDLEKWPGHLEHHLLGTNELGDKGAPGHLLQGLYDLSGDNNCAPNPSMPDDLENELVPEGKDKTDPEISIPGLGNLP